MSSASKLYASVCSHPIDLADGRPVAPGGRVEISEDAAALPHNKALIDEGTLIEIAPVKKAAKSSQKED